MSREDSLYRAVGQVAAQFDHRSRTLLNNISALAEMMADPACSMTQEECRIASETIFACAERLQLETETFTYMLTPGP